MGRANVEAIKLTRRHCRHGRIEMVGGNSTVGSMYDLPMGLLEVRCEHAPPPRVQGHQALELAMDFYDANCIGCPYRDGSGELPSLATVAGKRAAEKAAREAAAQRAADDRAWRHELRRERRHHFSSVKVTLFAISLCPWTASTEPTPAWVTHLPTRYELLDGSLMRPGARLSCSALS